MNPHSHSNRENRNQWFSRNRNGSGISEKRSIMGILVAISCQVRSQEDRRRLRPVKRLFSLNTWSQTQESTQPPASTTSQNRSSTSGRESLSQPRRNFPPPDTSRASKSRISGRLWKSQGHMSTKFQGVSAWRNRRRFSRIKGWCLMKLLQIRSLRHRRIGIRPISSIMALQSIGLVFSLRYLDAGTWMPLVAQAQENTTCARRSATRTHSSIRSTTRAGQERRSSWT